MRSATVEKPRTISGRRRVVSDVGDDPAVHLYRAYVASAVRALVASLTGATEDLRDALCAVEDDDALSIINDALDDFEIEIDAAIHQATEKLEV